MSVRRLIRTGTVTAAVAATIVLGAGTALASVGLEQGADRATYYDSSNNLYVWDNERDGNGVYAEWRDGSNHGQLWDGNGSKAGGSSQNVGEIDELRLCEDNHYCTSWVNV